MKILILGYGKEGKAVEAYFKDKNHDIDILDDFTDDTLAMTDFSAYDMVFRSPSVRPLSDTWTSSTKYFFDNCICPIIGVTGTKGKGTTCTIIGEILRALNFRVHTVGNIGTPAISELDSIQPDDVVIYELSSFQLWDMSVSPHISVILRIEPDHLNVHKDYSEYIYSKGNIAKFQKPEDTCIYFAGNSDSVLLSRLSSGHRIAYPEEHPSEALTDVLSSLSLPGAHNRENASAALAACAAYLDLSLDHFITKYHDQLKSALRAVKGLPHRLQFLREKDGVKYYDDNFSTTLPSLEVALTTFSSEKSILIMGGRDKTAYEDLPRIYDLLKNSENLQKIILIGESGHEFYAKYPDPRFILADSLKDAVLKSQESAISTGSSVVVMSPAAASFDMFENVYDRGAQYQQLIRDL